VAVLSCSSSTSPDAGVLANIGAGQQQWTITNVAPGHGLSENQKTTVAISGGDDPRITL